MTSEQGEPGGVSPRSFVCDAWNRIKIVKNSGGTTLKTYSYDGLNRRVSETASGTTTDLYYSANWQVLEEAVSGTTKSRYVWSPVYVDALILRDRDADGNSGNGLEERLWVQQDANFNVTALINGSGTVVERYAYDSFGKVTYMNASWTTIGSSAYGWQYLHQGGRLDASNGLYNFRNRDYSPTLGRWMTMDPIGYRGGDANLFRGLGDSPLSKLDPSGLILQFLLPLIIPAAPAIPGGIIAIVTPVVVTAPVWAPIAAVGAVVGMPWIMWGGGDDVIAGWVTGLDPVKIAAPNPGRVYPARPLPKYDGGAEGGGGDWGDGGGDVGLIDKPMPKPETQPKPKPERQVDPRPPFPEEDRREQDSCFAAGTPVLTLNGWRNIEEIRTGDLVLSRSEFDPHGIVESKIVEKVFVTQGQIWNLTVAEKTIRTSELHPFFVKSKGWTPCNKLNVGDLLVTQDGNAVRVEKLEDSGQSETLHNFRVADFHTYFVGKDEWGIAIWAHNASFYHYTDAIGFIDIIAKQMIKANLENKVYATKWELGPKTAELTLFAGNPAYTGHGDFVVAFDAKKGTVFVPTLGKAYEWIHYGTLRFGRHITVDPAGTGPNKFKD